MIECQSIGAFSGSPVFFEVERITQEKLFRTPEIYLGGIIKGHYDNIVESPVGYREFNAGLALVTPCYLLNELLNSKKAKGQREELLHKIRSQERERDNESI